MLAILILFLATEIDQQFLSIYKTIEQVLYALIYEIIDEKRYLVKIKNSILHHFCKSSCGQQLKLRYG